MEGGTKAFDAGLPAAMRVQLMPSERGGLKAIYRGRTFTMDMRNGSRCHWHCDLRGCKSRLSTDVYGKDHMVYKSTAHDEDLHQRALSGRKRKRCDATYKQQPIVPIGEFSYIMEKEEAGLQYWRCKYVSCPGRCRTHDSRLVVGPSEHHCMQFADKNCSEVVDQDTNAAAGEQHDQLPDDRETPKTMPQSCLHQHQNEMQESSPKKAKSQRSAEQKQLQGDQQNNRIAIKSEPVDYAAVLQDTQHAHHVSDSEDDDKDEDGRSTVSADSTNESIDEDGEKSNSGSGDEANDDTDQANSYASSKLKKAACRRRLLVITDEEDSDGEDEADEEHSHVVAEHSVSGGASLKGSKQQARCAEVLQMTDNAYDNDERELRSSVLRQMHRLLEAETKLAKQRRRIAVVRERLLERQLADLETASTPTSS